MCVAERANFINYYHGHGWGACVTVTYEMWRDCSTLHGASPLQPCVSGPSPGAWLSINVLPRCCGVKLGNGTYRAKVTSQTGQGTAYRAEEEKGFNLEMGISSWMKKGLDVTHDADKDLASLFSHFSPFFFQSFQIFLYSMFRITFHAPLLK